MPGLLGARGRIRSRVAPHERGRDRRRLRPERPEDLGLVGPVRALVRRARAHRPDVPAAQGHLAADRRHGVARGRRAADGADHRPCRVLRALPRRRLRAARRICSASRGAGLDDRHARRRPRARHGRASAPGHAAHVARPARRRRATRGGRCSTTRTRRRRSLARSSRSRCFATTPTRTMSSFLNGGAVGPESSSVKLLMAQAEQTLGETALDVLGDAGAASSGTSATSTRVPPASTAARSRSSATSSPTASSPSRRSEVDLELSDEQNWLAESRRDAALTPLGQPGGRAGTAPVVRASSGELVEFGALTVGDEGLGSSSSPDRTRARQAPRGGAVHRQRCDQVGGRAVRRQLAGRLSRR